MAVCQKAKVMMKLCQHVSKSMVGIIGGLPLSRSTTKEWVRFGEHDNGKLPKNFTGPEQWGKDAHATSHNGGRYHCRAIVIMSFLTQMSLKMTPGLSLILLVWTLLRSSK